MIIKLNKENFIKMSGYEETINFNDLKVLEINFITLDKWRVSKAIHQWGFHRIRKN